MFYSFRNFDLRDWPWSPEDYALSDAMVEAWTSFARTGKPMSSALPDWPRFDPDNAAIMLLDTEPRLANVPERERLDFWDRFNAARRTSRTVAEHA